MVTVVKLANKHCTCPKCQSELEYTFAEVKDFHVNHDYLGDYDLVQGIKCPVCETIIKVK